MLKSKNYLSSLGKTQLKSDKLLTEVLEALASIYLLAALRKQGRCFTKKGQVSSTCYKYLLNGRAKRATLRQF